MALVLAWKFNTTEMGGPGLTCKVRSSATHVGSVSTTTKPHGTSKAIPENITVPVGIAFSVKAADDWPGDTLKVLLAERVGVVATSSMQETPVGALNRAFTRASAIWSVFCSEALQAHTSAATPSVARERFDIWESP